MDRLADALEHYAEEAQIVLPAELVNNSVIMKNLKELLYRHRGNCPLVFTLHFGQRGEVDIQPNQDITIRPDMDFTRRLDSLLGYKSLALRMRPSRVEKPGNGA